MSFVQEMAQRLPFVIRDRRCLSLDEHELRWYHGFSRPFGSETRYFFTKILAEIKISKKAKENES